MGCKGSTEDVVNKLVVCSVACQSDDGVNTFGAIREGGLLGWASCGRNTVKFNGLILYIRAVTREVLWK